MGREHALLEVDPLFLPLGVTVGAWRVLGWRGRGAYGTLYRVERVGRELEGPFALKLAMHPRDERFQREAWLLSRIHSPYVPRLHDQGVWEHPFGAFPYVVMDWLEGEPLYDWAGRRNPTSRQALSLLAQVTRAVEATHAVGGVHRDVKGDNLLVRPADGRAFLTDFGSGHYRGAGTLTTKLLPPSTAAYRSPEAWGFLHVFERHPTAHYAASACDDLFALGVTAYRLVTDEYPPSSHPEKSWAEVGREGGLRLVPPRSLNLRVSAELDAIIMKLLALAPEERFRGQAREAAEALEQAAQGEGAELDVPLFSWAHEHLPRCRGPGGVQRVEEQDAVARKELAQRKATEQVQSEPLVVLARFQADALVRCSVAGVAGLTLLLAGLTMAWLTQGQGTRAVLGNDSGNANLVAVGELVCMSPELRPAGSSRPAVGRPLPEELFPSQRKPPCNRSGEVEIIGGCWFELRMAPPCKEEGKEDAYDWKGACYMPSYPVGRAPTSGPP